MKLIAELESHAPETPCLVSTATQSEPEAQQPVQPEDKAFMLEIAANLQTGLEALRKESDALRQEAGGLRSAVPKVRGEGGTAAACDMTLVHRALCSVPAWPLLCW